MKPRVIPWDNANNKVKSRVISQDNDDNNISQANEGNNENETKTKTRNKSENERVKPWVTQNNNDNKLKIRTRKEYQHRDNNNDNNNAPNNVIGVTNASQEDDTLNKGGLVLFLRIGKDKYNRLIIKEKGTMNTIKNGGKSSE